MKKMLIFILPVIMLVIGCEKSDDSEICGTWKRSTMTSDVYLTMDSNGTFVWDSTSAGKDYREGRGNYTYNAGQQTLVLSYTDKTRTDMYIVQSLSSSMMVLLDLDGNIATFKNNREYLKGLTAKRTNTTFLPRR